ncbi:MAG TPA: TRAP transporter small permease [Pseudogracilibacillus sp.]|nr:TRAP transporter small permease [Pseudogracilibacillus sp.]
MTFKRLDDLLGRLLEVIITLCLASVVVITFLQVLFRYVLQQPLTWSQEALMISFVYSVLFGAALAVKNDEHLKVDLFENVPGPVKKVLNVIQYIIVLSLIVALLYYGYLLVESNLESGQIVGMLPIKKAYVYMAIPVSALFMLYYQVKKVFK